MTMTRLVKHVSTATIALFLLGLACAPAHQEDGGKSPTPRDVSVRGVATAVVERAPFVRTLVATGTVTASPGHFASLGAPGPTRVARIFVAAGDSVAAGDPLIEFERPALEAEAQSRDANVSAAEKALARARRLTEAGVLPAKEVDRAEAELAAARAAAVVADRSRQLATLRSLLQGVVTRIDAVLGDAVDLGEDLVQVADMDTLDLVVTLSPETAAGVRSGQSVSFVAASGASAFADGAQSALLGDARVTGVAAVIDSLRRGVEVRARIQRMARPLRLGEALSVRIVTAELPAAITIPETALVPHEEGFEVFVVDGSGTAHARPVSVGARDGARVEILSGLDPGERVVVEGGYGLEDSVRVSTGGP